MDRQRVIGIFFFVFFNHLSPFFFIRGLIYFGVGLQGIPDLLCDVSATPRRRWLVLSGLLFIVARSLPVTSCMVYILLAQGPDRCPGSFCLFCPIRSAPDTFGVSADDVDPFLSHALEAADIAILDRLRRCFGADACSGIGTFSRHCVGWCCENIGAQFSALV